MRAIVLTIVAIQVGLGHPARAEDSAVSAPAITEMLPLFEKNHCEAIKDPVGQLFCGDPELNGVSAKLSVAVQDRLNRLPNRRLAIEENAGWIRERNSSCGVFGRQSISGRNFKFVKDCLLRESEERIEILTDPNFDCLATNTTAGILICSEPGLAIAKMELGGLVLGLIAKLKENEAKDAFAEFERWGRERDRKCDLADKDNVPLQELSSSEGCLTEYFSKQTAEVMAAKGDPRRVFGRHQLSPSPNADAVDLCVAQIHAANACGNFVAVNRVVQVDSDVDGPSAEVTAEVELVVLSPFAVCSPIASSCTGKCWDAKSGGKAKPAPATRDSFAVANRLSIEKVFTFQKTDGGDWRCNSAALPPIEAGVTLGSGP